jgi:ferric-dicitrate binding protein FerR (iron transport regulator)
MAKTRVLGGLAVLGTLAMLCGPAPSLAQVPQGCSMTALTDPPRQVLRCPGGLLIEAERETSYRVLDQDRDGRPDTAELSGRALLIELQGRRRGGFQVLTPHAIASVRGTVYAVDVTAAQTSVFVQEGRVAVAGGAGESVTLGAGQGIDVRPVAPLEVKTWGRERAQHLLARFGR